MPTKVGFQYSTLITFGAGSQTIGSDISVGPDTLVVIENGADLHFGLGACIRVNGGTLICGRPVTNKTSSQLRDQDSACDCHLITLTSDNNDWWRGVSIGAASKAYIYGTRIENACTGIRVEGDPSSDWCSSPVIQDTAIVWVECCTIAPGTSGTGWTNACNGLFSTKEIAGVYLHGANAAKTVINRVKVEKSEYQLGFAARGDHNYGPCRAPQVSDFFCERTYHAGFEVAHGDTLGGVCEDIDPADGSTRKLVTEVVAHSIHVEGGLAYGLKIWGAAHLRMTECEGGLDVTNPDDDLPVGAIITAGQWYKEFDPNSPHAAIYVNNYNPVNGGSFNTRIKFTDSKNTAIYCDRKGDFIDSSYTTNFLFRNNGRTRNDPDLKSTRTSSIVLSMDSTNQTLINAVNVRDMLYNKIYKTNTLLYADPSSHIDVVHAHFGPDTFTIVYPPITSGGGQFYTGYLSRDSNKTLGALVIRYCNPYIEVYYKHLREMRTGQTETQSPINSFPNPFSQTISLQVDILHDCQTSLRIYDLTGRCVRTILPGVFLSSGTYSYQWDGDTDIRETLLSGVYIAVLETGGIRSTKQFVMLR